MSINMFSHPNSMLEGLTPNRSVDEENDIRYTEHELPPSLGKEPSNEALKSWFSNYGWVYLYQITNNSDHKVHFKNPYWSTSGDIQPGSTESYNCKGYIPLWSYSEKYEIEYYNTTFNKTMKIYIKDLDGDWLISFWQDEVDEDIRKVPEPKLNLGSSTIALTINNFGYGIYSGTCFEDEGGMAWGS